MDRLSIRASIIRIRHGLRQRRMDAKNGKTYPDEPDSWITLHSNGEHVPLNREGVAIGGAGGWATGKSFSNAKSGKAKKKASTAPHKVAQGKDIAETYKGKGDIKSVIQAQGFDGVPKIVTQDEFDKAVKASSIIAQRAYAASDQKTLDAYREALYNGEWYVECTKGGSVYGQGMYTAADYNGKLSDDTEEEVKGYAEFYMSDLKHAGHENPVFYVETMTMDPGANIIDYNTLNDKWYGRMTAKERGAVITAYTEEQYKQIGKKYGKDAETYARYAGNDPSIPLSKAADAKKALAPNVITAVVNRVDEIGAEAKEKVKEEAGRVQKKAEKMQKKYEDANAYAAALGYDAVKVGFGFTDMTYTIILNRSKLIMLDGRNHKDAGDEGGAITFRKGKGNLIEAVQDGRVTGYVITNNYKKR